MPVLAEPTWAERARGVLADARVAALRTGGRQTGASRTTVAVEDDGDGLPLVWLERAEPAVAELAACRVAVLTVASPESPWGLRLVASFRMRRPDESGRRAYEPTLLSVRVTGPRTVTVPVEEFLRVDADPLRARRRALLAHLETDHGEDLLASVRAEGHDAELVVARARHRYGVELSLLGPDGVGSLRLAHAGDPAGRGPSETAWMGLSDVCRCP